MSLDALRRREVSKERNHDSSQTPKDDARSGSLSFLAANEQSQNEPFHQSHGRVDCEVLPEQILWVQSETQEKSLNRNQFRSQAEQRQTAELLRVSPTRTPEPQTNPAPAHVRDQLYRNVKSVSHPDFPQTAFNPLACRRSRSARARLCTRLHPMPGTPRNSPPHLPCLHARAGSSSARSPSTPPKAPPSSRFQ